MVQVWHRHYAYVAPPTTFSLGKHQSGRYIRPAAATTKQLPLNRLRPLIDKSDDKRHYVTFSWYLHKLPLNSHLVVI